MPSDEAKRLIREERLSVDSVQEGAKLISKPENYGQNRKRC